MLRAGSGGQQEEHGGAGAGQVGLPALSMQPPPPLADIFSISTHPELTETLPAFFPRWPQHP